MHRLKNRTALITGAATGIGRAIALRLAQEGANVAINYLDQSEQAEDVLAAANETCAEVEKAGCEHLAVQADVSNEDDVRRMFQEVRSAWDRFDILVNNAGIQIESPSHEMSADDFDKVIGVNLRGAFLCAREALRVFREQSSPGVILNDSSVHEIIPKPGFVSYSVSKGGMGNLTRTLALEYAKHGVRVNGVAPGAIMTPINKAWKDDPEARQAVASHIPMGRVGEVEDIAGVFAFLASDEAAYITGQTLYVDGGLTLYPEFAENWSS